MSRPLSIGIGQATNKGIKTINQDAIGTIIPTEPQLSAKGIVIAMADGISSSQVSQIASQTAVSSFLDDYYCTSDSWSVKTSVQKVVKSINYWLYAQTRNSRYRFEKDKGYITTFSALVLKSNTAHLFHSGDTRIYRVAGAQLEQLTSDHRRVVSSQVSYLTRALGIEQQLEIDYHSEEIERGDVFVLATDGVYEFVQNKQVINHIFNSETLDIAAQKIIDDALLAGSDDNLSIQIVRIEHVPDYQLEEVQQQLTHLPLPPRLHPRMQFDGYEIVREIYISSRSHVFLAQDLANQETVVIKTPSTELGNDSQYLESFMLEEWIAKRLNNPHIARATGLTRKRKYLYLVNEYIEGVSLNQWMIDNPKPSLNQVRSIIGQIAKGLQNFHRQEMIHQDIRPNNIMIDLTNTVKIIDFGSTYIAGVSAPLSAETLRGTQRYSAPEYFLGQPGSQRSDIYALAVITYQMLSGRFPYGTEIAQARNRSAQNRLSYKSLINDDSEFPLWIDDALRRALHIEPLKRHGELSEFIYDLHHPNKAYLSRSRPPLIERDPVMFWQGFCIVLLSVIIFQLTF